MLPSRTASFCLLMQLGPPFLQHPLVSATRCVPELLVPGRWLPSAGRPGPAAPGAQPMGGTALHAPALPDRPAPCPAPISGAPSGCSGSRGGPLQASRVHHIHGVSYVHRPVVRLPHGNGAMDSKEPTCAMGAGHMRPTQTACLLHEAAPQTGLRLSHRHPHPHRRWEVLPYPRTIPSPPHACTHMVLHRAHLHRDACTEPSEAWLRGVTPF